MVKGAVFFDTVREAAQYWVRGMNAFPTEMLETLGMAGEEFENVTAPLEGSEVCVIDESYPTNFEANEGTVTRYDEKRKLYAVEFDDGTEMECGPDRICLCHEERFPMWNKMWQFSDRHDNAWLESHITEMSRCRFRIYKNGRFGYFFGIDGSGYDFFDSHWIPLYKVRGLHWHKEENDD